MLIHVLSRARHSSIPLLAQRSEEALTAGRGQLVTLSCECENPTKNLVCCVRARQHRPLSPRPPSLSFFNSKSPLHTLEQPCSLNNISYNPTYPTAPLLYNPIHTQFNQAWYHQRQSLSLPGTASDSYRPQNSPSGDCHKLHSTAARSLLSHIQSCRLSKVMIMGHMVPTARSSRRPTRPNNARPFTASVPILQLCN
jgi:hypothetical protein